MARNLIGDPAGALEAFSWAAEMGPASAGELSGLAAARYRLGHVDEARSLLEEAARLHPHSTQVWLLLLALAARHGTPRGGELLEEARRWLPRDHALLLRAITALPRPERIPWLTRFAEQLDWSADELPGMLPHLHLALVVAVLGDESVAMQALDRVLAPQVDPEGSKGEPACVELRGEIGEVPPTPDALQLMASLCGRLDTSASLAALHALALSRAGRLDEARAEERRALALQSARAIASAELEDLGAHTSRWLYSEHILEVEGREALLS